MPSYLPSPSRGVVHLGPFPLRGYALCIILGVAAAVWIGDRRLRRRGYRGGIVADVAVWAVPFGLVGARLYHVITDNQLYFRHGENPWRAFAIWDGGLGIWGAIALGAVGAYIPVRRMGIPFGLFADAVAPGLAVAQAVGRFGNWFNQELYGRPSGLPWALHIDLAHRLPQYADVATYQPTFLYESLWDLGVAALVIVAGQRRWFGRLTRGRAFFLYVAAYTVGRGWIEYLRIDEAHRFFGLRLNDYTCIILFAVSVIYMIRVKGDEGVRRPGTGLDVAAPGAPDLIDATDETHAGEPAEEAGGTPSAADDPVSAAGPGPGPST